MSNVLFDLKMNAVTKQGELAKLSGLPSIGLGLDYVVVSKRKEPWKYGETHSVVLNEWTPKQESQEKSDEDISIEDIPF